MPADREALEPGIGAKARPPGDAWLIPLPSGRCGGGRWLPVMDFVLEVAAPRVEGIIDHHALLEHGVVVRVVCRQSERDSVQRMVRGVDILADAVRVTLGSKGRNVVLNKSFGAPRITKDA